MNKFEQITFLRDVIITFFDTFFRGNDTDAFLTSVEMTFKKDKEELRKSMKLCFILQVVTFSFSLEKLIQMTLSLMKKAFGKRHPIITAHGPLKDLFP